MGGRQGPGQFSLKYQIHMFLIFYEMNFYLIFFLKKGKMVRKETKLRIAVVIYSDLCIALHVEV